MAREREGVGSMFLTLIAGRTQYCVLCTVIVFVNMLFSVMSLISAVVTIFTVPWLPTSTSTTQR